jgi:hypothetical protein
MAKHNKKFTLTEKDAKDAPVKDIEWEGEEVGVESTTKLNDDKGTGQKIILRFFTFTANPEVFKQHKPTAQELFNTHQKGMEAMLWADGLTPVNIIEPRLLFSKDNSRYRFVVSCIPSLGQSIIETPQTLTELIA